MKELLQILLDRLNVVPGIKNVEVFNNQYTKANEKQQELLFFPAVYVEIPRVEYESGLGDYQYGTATITVHVVNESPFQGTDTTIYELKDTVHQYLHKYSTGYFNPLVRTGEETDTNHDNLYIYKISYTTRFTELTQLVEPVESVTVNEIDVLYDMDDDNDEIVIDKIN